MMYHKWDFSAFVQVIKIKNEKKPIFTVYDKCDG